MSQDASFVAIKLPAVNIQAEDLTRCFVATGVAAFIDGGADDASATPVTRRVSVVNGDIADGAVLLPATDAVGHSRIVSTSSGSSAVIVRFPAGSTSLHGADTSVSIPSDTSATFIKVSATKYLVIKGTS